MSYAEIVRVEAEILADGTRTGSVTTFWETIALPQSEERSIQPNNNLKNAVPNELHESLTAIIFNIYHHGWPIVEIEFSLSRSPALGLDQSTTSWSHVGLTRRQELCPICQILAARPSLL